MRCLTINRADFEEAFELGSVDAEAYLDLETGAVILLTEDDRFSVDDSSDDGASLAAQVEAEFETRFISIPRQDSREGYQDMERFIATLEDEHLREMLEVAIQGSGAFRRFKDALYRHPDGQKAWYKFRDARVEARMQDWFEMHDLDVTWV
ncbi:MAG: UPF0158 family protein [Anaerolineae bacterium]|nr:UPF0158 family protein [Anaerolineae bacterium]NUQ06127.1 hypothetical protein [Anaerolineae bacterium]